MRAPIVHRIIAHAPRGANQRFPSLASWIAAHHDECV